MPIINRLTTSVLRRPMRSPIIPNTMPPSGRATKPTANVASASSVAASGLPTTKNCLSNTSTAHAANAKKSYHSSVVPTVQANIRLARFFIAHVSGRFCG